MKRERKHDLLGQMFGRLTVVRLERTISKTGRTTAGWFCRCECGAEKTATTWALRSGNTSSCGCVSREATRVRGVARRQINTGQTYGRLTVISPASKTTSDGRPRLFYECQCTCGNRALRHYGQLMGSRVSCGCWRAEINKVKSTTHGGSSRENRDNRYLLWAGMINRCKNPNVKAFKDYGGRGITVCDRWRYGEDGKSGFECFVADMGERLEGYSLDRIDNDGNYEPGNCRWATALEQRHNQRPRRTRKVSGIAA